MGVTTTRDAWGHSDQWRTQRGRVPWVHGNPFRIPSYSEGHACRPTERSSIYSAFVRIIYRSRYTTLTAVKYRQRDRLSAACYSLFGARFSFDSHAHRAIRIHDTLASHGIACAAASRLRLMHAFDIRGATVYSIYMRCHVFVPMVMSSGRRPASCYITLV